MLKCPVILAALALTLTLVTATEAHAQSLFPVGNVWTLGDSKTYGVTDPPGGCGPRDPMYATVVSKWGGTFIGTLSGGADGFGGNLATCPTSGVALQSDGHSGDHSLDITQGVSTWAGSIATPKFVMVHVGTNDLIAQQTAPPVQGWNMDRFYREYDAMVQTMLPLEPKATTIWVLSNMDPMPSLISVPVTFAQVNDYIGQEVKKYQRQGYQIYLMNAFSGCGLGVAGDYNAGGIHELPQGYSKIANCYTHTMSTLQPRRAYRREGRAGGSMRLRPRPTGWRAVAVSQVDALIEEDYAILFSGGAPLSDSYKGMLRRQISGLSDIESTLWDRVPLSASQKALASRAGVPIQ